MKKDVKPALRPIPFLITLMGCALLACTPLCSAQVQQNGRPAPDFTRNDLRRQPIHLRAYRGKVVLLNFWATWCAPCLQEMPRFSQWQSRYASQGLQIVGISMDDADPPVRRLQQRLAVNYPIVMGDEELGNLYGGILGLPVSFLLDRQGRIHSRYQGETDLDSLEREVQSLLAAPTVVSHR